MAAQTDNLYALLRLPRDATREEIRAAYHDAARRHHPDANTDPDATEEFIQIQKAFETLSNPSSRKDYDFDNPPKDLPPQLKIKSYLSRKNLMPIPDPQLLFLLLDIQVEGVEKIRTPLNLCILIDRSTSMKGKRMDMVKETSRHLVQQLKPEDFLSVVTFGDRAEIVIPPGRNQDKRKIDAQISLIQPYGGTELFHGLQLAYRQVARNRKSTIINHIILITDGHTYGDEQNCIELAEEASLDGIHISGFGIGSEWNDSFLDKLTSITGGSSMYVANAREIRPFLQEKFGALNQTIAENVRLRMPELDENIRLNYVFRLQPEPTRLEQKRNISIGNIQDGKSLRFVMEFLIEGIQPDAQSLKVLDGSLWMEIPSRNVPTVRRPVAFELAMSKSDELEPPPPEIDQAMASLNFYRMQEQARAELENGNFEAATRRLKNLASQLLGDGEYKLATKILNEASVIENGDLTNDELRKEVKYGTRALMLPPGEGIYEL